MTFAFRVDSSTHIGTGHLIRCLTLAQMLRDHGTNSVFICRQLDGAATLRIAKAKFEVRYLADDHRKNYSQEGFDAIETLKLLDDHTNVRVIVDHYDLTLEWETIVAGQVKDLTVIEDLAHRQHRCDLLINQNILSSQAQEYSASLTGVGQSLVGPHYALLQPDYAQLRTMRYDKISEVKKIVAFMGGSDSDNSTEFVLRVLTNMDLKHTEVDAVIGSSNPYRSTILQKFQDNRSIRFHVDVPSMASLLATADLAIGAGGTANWERMCLGVPSLVFDIAENQRNICVELAREGMIEYAGNAKSVSATLLESSISKLISDGELRSQYSLRGQITVDGLGARRVAEKLLPGSAEFLTLRTCQAIDVVNYFQWVNEASVRQNSLTTDQIDWTEHEEWFVARLRDPTCRMFVLLMGDLPIGQIRFEKSNDTWSINYSLDEIVRGRGWGRHLVELGIAEMKNLKVGAFVAKVKTTNIASQRIFEQLGFLRSVQSNDSVQHFELRL